MLRSSIRNGVLIAGGAAAALLLAGCQGGADPADPDVRTTSQSPTSLASPLPGSASARSASARSAPAGDAASAGGTECKVADLSLRLNDGEGTAGTYYRALIFTNKGRRTCTIQGFPGVSYVTGDDGHQVGQAAERNGAKKPAVTLKPGDSANVTIGFRDVDAFDETSCEPTETRGLRVYPPHEYDSMFVPADGRGCAGKVQESQLTVTSVEPGTEPA
jgi:uncharacterized protein DUF4232